MYIKKLKPTSLHLNLRWDHYKSILFWLQISEAMVALNFPPRFGDSEGWPTNTFAKSNLLLNFEKHKSSYSGRKFVTFKKKNSVPKDLLNTIKCYILPVAEVQYVNTKYLFSNIFKEQPFFPRQDSFYINRLVCVHILDIFSCNLLDTSRG